jgi:cytochrome c-type biogenesis protein CcmH
MKRGQSLLDSWASASRRVVNTAIRAVLIGTLLGCTAWAACAKDAQLVSAEPDLDRRVQEVTAELRCLVCQNQTIADSQASLAVDLRHQVRELLRKGQSKSQIIDYMTARYGDFVLYRPPLKPTTLLLWFAPALLLCGGLSALWLVLRRRSRMPADCFEAEAEPEPSADDDVAATAATHRALAR